MTRVAVMGAGSWGTAFSIVLADAGADVVLWARRPELRDEINSSHTNGGYLPDVALPVNISATSDVSTALRGAELVVLAVPSQTLRANLEQWSTEVPDDSALVSLMKGIEVSTGHRMSEVVSEVTGAEADRIVVLSGPNLAREIAERQPSVSVVGCASRALGERLRRATSTDYFQTYYTHDVIGVELAGAVKNVIALAVGMAEGMGYGHNSQASIVTRGLAEMSRLGAELGADPRTFAGLAGMGDMMATCSSPLSRNRTVGVQLGSGRSLAEALAGTSQVAEGVRTCESVLRLARAHDVYVPITEQVSRVVHGGVTPHEIVAHLMASASRAGHESD